MLDVNFDSIPTALASRPQWVAWQSIEARKIPYCGAWRTAKVNDPATWLSLEAATKLYRSCAYDGIGFVFVDGDELVGVDLDGCRDPHSGAVADWALSVVDLLDSYTEISPSGSGLKIFAEGLLPAKGHRDRLPFDGRGGKAAGLEIYSAGRYFAVTGHRFTGAGLHNEPQPRQEQLERLYYFKEQGFSLCLG